MFLLRYKAVSVSQAPVPNCQDALSLKITRECGTKFWPDWLLMLYCKFQLSDRPLTYNLILKMQQTTEVIKAHFLTVHPCYFSTV